MNISRRTLTVHLCSVLFGLGAWVTLNGVWVELPELVAYLPEGWTLPSYLSIIVQLANIGPLMYSVIGYISPYKHIDVLAVTVTTAIGSIACLLLAFFWNRTAFVFGQQRSVALLPLVFLMALVDCTSSVLFLPFMATVKKKYLISYLIGEGLSGFVPSIMALIQGVGGNPECRNSTTLNTTIPDTNVTVPALEAVYPPPLFSASVFFVLLFFLDLLSLVSFFVLNYSSYLKSEKILYKQSSILDRDQEMIESITRLSIRESSPGISHTFSQRRVPENRTIKFKSKYYLYLLQAWLCALSNGVFTSVQSFSALPYGNTVFHLTVSLSTMANPLACFVAIFVPTKKISVINILVIVGTSISCYLMATAVLSPNPPFVNQLNGKILIITAWILFSAIFSYSKASVASILREGGRNDLFWCGVWTQVGSALGSLIIFILINYYNFFQSYYPCT